LEESSDILKNENNQVRHAGTAGNLRMARKHSPLALIWARHPRAGPSREAESGYLTGPAPCVEAVCSAYRFGAVRWTRLNALPNALSEA
jgi:hypothetical protein